MILLLRIYFKDQINKLRVDFLKKASLLSEILDLPPQITVAIMKYLFEKILGVVCNMRVARVCKRLGVWFEMSCQISYSVWRAFYQIE